MPDTTPAALNAPAISPWRNSDYPLSLVQALPRVNALPFERLIGRECAWRTPDSSCPGTGEGATKGVLLRHRDAFHAIHAHYVHANQSILRFKSATRGEYAADLIFEIDVHREDPPYPQPIDYSPIIKNALIAGRRIFDFLTDELLVHPNWITTCASRMGVSVVVDWRAFGPRRLWELLMVIRWVETQVFAPEELVGLGAKIDPAIYSASDLARQPGQLGAHWLRPVGALHTKSSHQTLWFRKAPVPHELFGPEHANRITLASRGASAESSTSDWAHPKNLLQWPEARWPGADSVFEGKLPLASRLLERLEDHTLIAALPTAYQQEITSARSRSVGRPKIITSPGAHRQLSEEAIRRFAETLDPTFRERGDRFQLRCPRSGCKAHGQKAALYKESGVFTCFRCAPGAGLALRVLALELGIGHLLPRASPSSQPIQRRLVEDFAAPETISAETTVIERDFLQLDEARADQVSVIEEFLDDARSRLLVLAAAPGIGKTTAAAEVARRRGLQLRAFMSRDDAKEEFAKLIPEARIILGRRQGVNCWNPDLDEVTSRHEAVAATLCGRCEHKDKKCAVEGYWSQFSQLPHEVPLVLHHGHAIHADLAMLDNSAAIDFIDEDALGATIEEVDLDGRELSLLRTRLTIDETGLDDDGSTGLGAESLGARTRRCASTARWEEVISGLERRLCTDTVLLHDARFVAHGSVTDLALADLLFRDPQLRDAVSELTCEHVEAVRADVAVLRDLRQCLRDTGLADNDERELLARPIDRVYEFVEALRGLLYSWQTRRNSVSALQALHQDRGNSWPLRLTIPHKLVPHSNKIIHASSSVTAERLKLMHAPATFDKRWLVYRPRLPQRDRWTVIADRNYGKGCLLTGKGADKTRASVFETARKLIEVEGKRTRLPVAVIGPAAIVNEFNRAVLEKLPEELEMPFSSRRAERAAKLRERTERHGYITGYAYGVAGSNSFSVTVDEQPMFLRALIVLGNCVPNLADFASTHRGLFAGDETFASVEGYPDVTTVTDLVVDWSIAFRTIPVPGTEANGEVTVLTNVPGYAAPVANEVLAGTFEGELLQIAGRLRPHIPDPRDPTLASHVYLFGAAVVPGVHVDRVLALDDLRAELGLVVEQKRRRGRAPTLSIEDQVRSRVRNEGKPATIRWLVETLIKARCELPLATARLIFEDISIDYGAKEAEIALQTMRSLLTG